MSGQNPSATGVVSTSTRQSDHPVHALFLERWSPRAFSAEPLPREQLMTLLEAARWAPSAFNLQPWRFVWALRDTPAWPPLFGALTPRNQVWVQHASALVAVVSRQTAQLPGGDGWRPNDWHAFDSGAAWASLAFQATLSGWAAHAMAGFNAEALASSIALPADHSLQAMVAIGKVADKSVLPPDLQAREAPNSRLPLATLAFEGTFPDLPQSA